MRKFKTKRTLRRERAAWVQYAIKLEKDIQAEINSRAFAHQALAACIEERNEAIRDFEYMEKRYRNV